MDYRLPGCSVHVILQVRILEWVAICFSKQLYPIKLILKIKKKKGKKSQVTSTKFDLGVSLPIEMVV